MNCIVCERPITDGHPRGMLDGRLAHQSCVADCVDRPDLYETVKARIARIDERDDGGPAYPHITETADSGRITAVETGMSLRDYFAAKAMQGYMRLAYSHSGGYMQYATHAEQAAKCAYQLADAMLAERAK